MKFFRRSLTEKRLRKAPRRRILFVSHEATRTGAPKIVLNVLKHFRQNCDIDCESILIEGGHLAGEFHQHSLATDVLNQPRTMNDKLRRKMNRIVHRDKQTAPIVAVCNSLESRFVAAELANNGVPVVSLVHELPSSYQPEDYQLILNSSRHIVFPDEAVFNATASKVSLSAQQVSVIPQGLLNPDFGKGIARAEAAAQIRQNLSLPSDSFIVLGCGTLDLRKGIDHFGIVARQVVELGRSTDKPVHFAWVGGGPQWTHSLFHYVQMDLARSAARDHVHFVGEQQNVEPWFVGSDAFLLTSRVDPFPCVVHEAMAARLPVITFADNGGAQSAIRDGAGYVVPYGNHEQVARLIRDLATQPEMSEAVVEKASDRVQTRYRFEDYGDRLIDLCESVSGESFRKECQPTQTSMSRAA